MEIAFLRDEFLRLSALYPELRHALAVGDEHWLFGDDYYSIIAELEHLWHGDYGLKVLGREQMSNDIRCLSFSLWRGTPDEGRANEAVELFRSLARTAVGCVDIKPFSDRVAPRYRVEAGMKPLSLSAKYVIIDPPPPDDRDHEWIGHIFATASVQPSRVWIGRQDGPRRCDVFILPFDTFRASALAVDATESNSGGQKKIKPTPETLKIIRRIEAGRTNDEINAQLGVAVGTVRTVRSRLKSGGYVL